ncbi:MAG: CapA family protein [Acidimicrobiia bacterium]|nr:CapA family protein [Acidimicrobiia bacterium]
MRPPRTSTARPALWTVVLASAITVALLAAYVVWRVGDDGGSTRDATASSEAAPDGKAPDAEPTATDGGPSRSFTIAATGDFLIHSPVWNQALSNGGGVGYDFGPMLEAVTPEISAADLAICHVETPLSADNSDLSGYPLFNAPFELAGAISAAGYDACSTVSNHSLDQGAEGIETTLGHLDAAGIEHAGTARSAEEAAEPNLYDVEGVQVGHLAYAYGFNGIPIPAGMPWLVNEIDADRILADAGTLREAGSEFTVVSLQWGQEDLRDPTPEQRALAQQLLGSDDIDLIIGHHVHVVQPMEKIDDKYVIYGVGNFLSNQSEACCPAGSQDGVIVHVEVEEQPDGSFLATSVTYTPTFVERPDYRIVPVSAASNPASYARTLEAVTLLGPYKFDGSPTL